uniref:Uncharacterized protein n=1 Tax=Coccidioides posadasii RMSCC 3488 TaxID=454284 RepID=A0A0J6FFK3_COCPO|nr:hypothetical protein CPAG_03982 [Coccidioides posadasii RMSCC 3488]
MSRQVDCACELQVALTLRKALFIRDIFHSNAVLGVRPQKSCCYGPTSSNFYMHSPTCRVVGDPTRLILRDLLISRSQRQKAVTKGEMSPGTVSVTAHHNELHAGSTQRRADRDGG